MCAPLSLKIPSMPVIDAIASSCSFHRVEERARGLLAHVDASMLQWCTPSGSKQADGRLRIRLQVLDGLAEELERDGDVVGSTYQTCEMLVTFGVPSGLHVARIDWSAPASTAWPLRGSRATAGDATSGARTRRLVEDLRDLEAESVHALLRHPTPHLLRALFRHEHAVRVDEWERVDRRARTDLRISSLAMRPLSWTLR
jgi:hypothetical protein